jgi:hypothetical protein
VRDPNAFRADRVAATLSAGAEGEPRLWSLATDKHGEGRSCAFTGPKIINGGGRSEVQAAHIRPVTSTSSGPDSPRNGMALYCLFAPVWRGGDLSPYDPHRQTRIINILLSAMRGGLIMEGLWHRRTAGAEEERISDQLWDYRAGALERRRDNEANRPRGPSKAALTTRKRREKYFRRNPVYPLKRLDSNEGIQGNPSFSNPQIDPFSSPKRGSPRHSKSYSSAVSTRRN